MVFSRVMVQGFSSQVLEDRRSRGGVRRPQRGRRVLWWLVQVAEGGNEDKAKECVETCWCT